MLVSARTRSAAVAVTVPFALLFLPVLLGSLTSARAGSSAVLGLLPDALLQIPQTVKLFNLYALGGQVTGSVPLLFLLYGGLTLLLLPVLSLTCRRQDLR